MLKINAYSKNKNLPVSLDTFGRNGLLEKVINDQPFDGDIIAEALNGTRRIYDKYKAVFQSDELIRLEAVDYCDNVYVIEIRIEHSLKDRLFAKTVAARDRYLATREGDYNHEKLYGAFCSLYELIEDSELEGEYEEWLIKTGNER